MGRLLWQRMGDEILHSEGNGGFEGLRWQPRQQLPIHIGTRRFATKTQSVPNLGFLIANPLRDGIAASRSREKSTNSRGQRGR